MDPERIKEIFEAFFEKFKKTEGDGSSWSAVWFDQSPVKGKFEINMTKCPRGTRFKVFVDNRKIGEIEGWDHFVQGIEKLTADSPGLYDPEEFFGGMAEMI